MESTKEYVRNELKRGVYQEAIKLHLREKQLSEAKINEIFTTLQKEDSSLPIDLSLLTSKDTNKKIHSLPKVFFFMKGLIFIIAITSCIIYAGSFFLPKWPQQSEIIPSLLTDSPEMKPTNLVPFDKRIGEYTFKITPVKEYKIQGLIVSSFEFEVPFNVMNKDNPALKRDLCLVWGPNILNEVYKYVRIQSADYSCSIYEPDPSSSKFSLDYLTNNHLIPSSEAIKEKIMKARVGNQVRIKGYLINYEIYKDGNLEGEIKTSTVLGDPNCEVIYVTDFETLYEGNPNVIAARKYSYQIMLPFGTMFIVSLVLPLFLKRFW